MITPAFAQQFAYDWLNAWNRHDLEAILSHYADDIQFASPYVVLLADEPSGVLHGKAALRNYWHKGLQRIPELHFDLSDVLIGIDSLTLYYRGHNGMAAETFVFNASGLVQQAMACYALPTSD